MVQREPSDVQRAQELGLRPSLSRRWEFVPVCWEFLHSQCPDLLLPCLNSSR